MKAFIHALSKSFCSFIMTENVIKNFWELFSGLGLKLSVRAMQTPTLKGD